MAKKRMSRSGMLLLELMMGILIFSLAAAVCIQVFLKAHDLSQRAQELTQAVNTCATAAEILRSADTQAQALERLAQQYPQLERQGEQASAQQAQGRLEVRWQSRERLTQYSILWLDAQGRQVYELELEQAEGAEP